MEDGVHIVNQQYDIEYANPALRIALRSLLDAEPDLEVVGEAEDMSGLLCLGEIQPDVVVLDIGLPDLQGFEALRHLSCGLPDAHVLLLTDHEDPGLVQDALVAGAAGCVVGQAAESTLAAAIRAVAQGYLYVQLGVMRVLLLDLRPQPAWPKEGADDLTPREVDVLRLIAEGYTNRQVAEELGLSVRTVQSHRESIMVKLGLHGRAELVRYAANRRLVAGSARQQHSQSRSRHP